MKHYFITGIRKDAEVIAVSVFGRLIMINIL